MKIILFFVLFATSQADVLSQARNKGATLKPISACCDIPELGDPKPLMECSNPKLPGPCNDIQCVFDKSGFLEDVSTLNKEAYKAHLRKWAEDHKGWSDAVEKAIKDCVDKNIRQYLNDPCKAYDVFTCTGIALLKCNDIQCVFDKSGFLEDVSTLNKEAYKAHLRKWAEDHKGWSDAVEKAIKDCVDKNIRQYLNDPCKAYDVFTCTGIALLKKCPEASWKC